MTAVSSLISLMEVIGTPAATEAASMLKVMVEQTDSFRSLVAEAVAQSVRKNGLDGIERAQNQIKSMVNRRDGRGDVDFSDTLALALAAAIDREGDALNRMVVREQVALLRTAFTTVGAALYSSIDTIDFTRRGP